MSLQNPFHLSKTHRRDRRKHDTTTELLDL